MTDTLPPSTHGLLHPRRIVGFERSEAHWYTCAGSLRDRLSLALWHGSLDADSPEFIEADGQVLAVVAVWPTDASGFLNNEPLGQVVVAPWVVPEKLFARLAEIHRTWHLGRHDLWVSGGASPVITPCPRSLLHYAWQDRLELALRVQREAASLHTRLLAGVWPTQDALKPDGAGASY